MPVSPHQGRVDISTIMNTKNKPPANDILSEVLIGMSDGLIVPFALTAGLTRIPDPGSTVVTAGLVAMTAGAIAMGFGGYLTGRSEADIYKTEPRNPTPSSVKEDPRAFFANLGLSEEMQAKAAEELMNDKKQLNELLGQHEKQPSATSAPLKSGLTIGLSYALGGLITVGPYLFVEDINYALKISAGITLASLCMLGFIKSRITGRHPLWGAFRTVLVGALAAAGSMIVAKIFVQ